MPLLCSKPSHSPSCSSKYKLKLYKSHYNMGPSYLSEISPTHPPLFQPHLICNRNVDFGRLDFQKLKMIQ